MGALALEDTIHAAEKNQIDEETKAHSIKKTKQNVSVEMKIPTDNKDFYYPEPITIQVFLFKPYPISGAQVSGVVIPPYSKPFTITFSENILVGWTLPESGSYTAVITDLEEDGQYQVRIEANDNDNTAHFAKPFGEDLPDSQSTNDSDQSAGLVTPFNIESIISINTFGYTGKHRLPPLKITTLYASIDSDQCIRLFWQTPANIGQDGRYEIRYSSQSITSIEAWNKANLGYEGKYSSKAGETEEHEICGLAKGIFYFCVVSRNNIALQSKISNDYIVVVK
jgi:hypothetical protein